ncbi:type I toxin-antitoxin system ptaRNA1 family toxin [Vreelandella populi]|nr:hypothetical protein ELY40_13520 [Halomonas populi]
MSSVANLFTVNYQAETSRAKKKGFHEALSTIHQAIGR